MGNPHAAEEITQTVFIILARKAGSLSAKTVLSGWLYQTARLTVANYRRNEFRRVRREQEAHMQSVMNEPESDVWQQIAPMLDDALGELGEKDRHAIVLRFFENKSLGEVGAVLGTSQEAARMRVNRALEKLRNFFSRRGVTLSATVIAGAVAANSVQAAPSHLGASVTAGGLSKVAVASAQWLVQATLQKMLWSKMRAALLTALGLSLLGGALILYRQSRGLAFFSSTTNRVTTNSNTLQPAVAGSAVIKIKLLGTSGLPFEVAYSTDGQPHTAKGVLPREVSFTADAFNANIKVQGPGEFGLQVYRGDLQQVSAPAAPITGTRTLTITGKAGGAGIALSAKPN